MIIKSSLLENPYVVPENYATSLLCLRYSFPQRCPSAMTSKFFITILKQKPFCICLWIPAIFPRLPTEGRRSSRVSKLPFLCAAHPTSPAALIPHWTGASCMWLFCFFLSWHFLHILKTVKLVRFNINSNLVTFNNEDFVKSNKSQWMFCKNYSFRQKAFFSLLFGLLLLMVVVVVVVILFSESKGFSDVLMKTLPCCQV